MTTANSGFTPLVTVVGFHHARGPEVESWFGAEEGTDPSIVHDWPLLPFMALSDGAHAATEDFSYFTLLRPATETVPATSLFGISCTRQMDASALLNRPADVTRSTVQKAVVVITDSPQFFGVLRERLSVVTSAWFAQKDFLETEILKRFQDSLKEEYERAKLAENEEDRDQYLGMSLRQLVREFKWQTLVLFKCCLLQPKMLFFGSRCERLCMMQFSLISLIPGLIRNLQDCADPELESYERNLVKPTSLKTSDRSSLLANMGLPLQIFGKGSLYGPYTPLQQLDILADYGTKSYIVGSTNSLLLQQKDRYSDILINLDETTINITSSSLRSALTLSAADRRWMDFITQSVNDTWDDANPDRPSTLGYVGSEEFIRLQFEEYLESLISAVKYHNYLAVNLHNPKAHLPDVEGDPSTDFGADWIEAWKRTENYRIWNNHTEIHVFDIVAPKHPCAGGMTIEDVQRRLAQQVQELHLDERFASGKEVLGRNLAAGKERASTVFNKLYSDMEAIRESQRRRAEDARILAEKNGGTTPTTAGFSPDISKVQTTAQSVGSKAGAYMSSWGSWASEKRKTGWGRSSSSTQAKYALKEQDFTPREILAEKPRVAAVLPAVSAPVTSGESRRPRTQESYNESIFDADSGKSDDTPEEPVETPKVSDKSATAKVEVSTAISEAEVFSKEPAPKSLTELKTQNEPETFDVADTVKQLEMVKEPEVVEEKETQKEAETPKETMTSAI